MPLTPPRDAARSRTAILDAAEALFAEHGYDATSLAQVGVGSGVSRGTPGYFFGSKEALYRAVLDRCFGLAREAVRTGRLRAERSGSLPEEVLAGVASDYVDFASQHPAFVRLMHREALGEGPDLEPTPAGLAVGAEAVEALASELDLPQTEARHLALSLLALTWFPVLHRGTTVPGVGLHADSAAFLAARKHHITTLLCATVRQGDAPAPRSSR